MRLIDADAIKIPKGFFEKVDNVPKFYDWLDDQPTIEAEPVRRGRWEIHEDDSWSGGGFTKCSACGYGFAWGAFFEVEEWEFCPYCGAKMEEVPE